MKRTPFFSREGTHPQLKLRIHEMFAAIIKQAICHRQFSSPKSTLIWSYLLVSFTSDFGYFSARAIP
jgi:hypothetical protein